MRDYHGKSTLKWVGDGDFSCDQISLEAFKNFRGGSDISPPVPPTACKDKISDFWIYWWSADSSVTDLTIRTPVNQWVSQGPQIGWTGPHSTWLHSPVRMFRKKIVFISCVSWKNSQAKFVWKIGGCERAGLLRGALEPDDTDKLFQGRITKEEHWNLMILTNFSWS